MILFVSPAGPATSQASSRDKITGMTYIDNGATTAAPFDIVINEIMVNPSPPAGLPEAEYIELFNRSARAANLENWTLTIGTGSRLLPGSVTIGPGDFLLITNEKYQPLLEPYGDVLGVPALPVLAKREGTIILRDAVANVISMVNYSDRWYGGSRKSEGGWSLEQIDPFNPCGGYTNWKASTDSRGGTPGAPNSVAAINPDNIPPEAVRITMLSESNIRLHFSKQMHPLSDWSATGYYAEGAGNPLYAIPVIPFYEAVDLFFGSIFMENTIYNLKTSAALYDCAGNLLKHGKKLKFAIPEFPVKNDIIINEILFNPFPGGTNFIELVNISGKTLDLKQMMVSGMRHGQQQAPWPVVPEGYLFFPGEYLVLTTAPDIVMDHYYTPAPESFLETERMPSMNIDEGRIIFEDLQGNILEDVSYSSDMHSPLLTGKKGVSLERLGYVLPSYRPDSWFSAAEASGFATPGYRNSQSSPSISRISNFLSVEPKIFAPDNSGYDDEVYINYALDKPGYAGNINIFDARGRLVRRLVRNELLGTTGHYPWNGRDESGRVPDIGIYIILMEIFHPDGDVTTSRESVVLAGRSN